MGAFSISPSELYARIGTADAPLIFDVCKCEDYDQLPRLIPGALTGKPALPPGLRAESVLGKKPAEAPAPTPSPAPTAPDAN